MSLRFHFHPLSSYCHKALIALYENGTEFEPIQLDLSKDDVTSQFRKISPFGKMPALEDTKRGQIVNEATVIIEYLDEHYRGVTKFIPADADQALRIRTWDRFFDNYLHENMQRTVGDALRPQDKRDPFGVEEARKRIHEFYEFLEKHMAGREWIGAHFSLSDCAASPALFYANTIYPLGSKYQNARGYLGRLMTRPSYARVLKEAEPFFKYFPLEPKPQRTLQAV